MQEPKKNDVLTDVEKHLQRWLLLWKTLKLENMWSF